jgi:GMP synthase (glutamine-hydrolysing)
LALQPKVGWKLWQNNDSIAFLHAALFMPHASVSLPFLVVKTGSTMPELKAQRGDFEDWILQGLNISRDRSMVVDVSLGEKLPPPQTIGGVAITGSHAMVSERRDWSEYTAAWLALVADKQIPTLGICYGHQLLAHALGGHVDYNPKGREVGTIAVTLHDEAQTDLLFQDLPAQIAVNLSHRQAVLDLPTDVTLLASSDMADHVAFRYGETVWGLQFHPEFDQMIIQSYIRYAQAGLIAEGQDPADLYDSATETPYGRKVLARFAALVS